MEDRGAGEQRQLLRAGIHHVGIDPRPGRSGPDAGQAVLRLVHHRAPTGNVVADQSRNADAEIDVGAVGHVLRTTPRHLVPIERLDGCPHLRRSGSATTRFTNIPGVTTRSGSNGVSETSFTSTAVIRSEEHTSELQSLLRISYAVFCLKTK